MNRKRLGQLLIGGVFTLCAAAVAALIDLVEKEEAKRAAAKASADGKRPAPEEESR